MWVPACKMRLMCLRLWIQGRRERETKEGKNGKGERSADKKKGKGEADKMKDERDERTKKQGKLEGDR